MFLKGFKLVHLDSSLFYVGSNHEFTVSCFSVFYTKGKGNKCLQYADTNPSIYRYHIPEDLNLNIRCIQNLNWRGAYSALKFSVDVYLFLFRGGGRGKGVCEL
jgi:hypothetical protein